MEVKAGYRKTDIGVIPNEWDVKYLGELSTVCSGGTPSRTNPNYWNGNIPWVTTSEVDFCTIKKASQFVTEAGLSNSAAKILPPGTLLMALYGQGKTRGKVGLLGLTAATNQACSAILLKPIVFREFIFHFLVKNYEEIRKLSNTGNQENLNSSIVRSIPVLVPPFPEQQAIASALSDADALIESLEQLIEKKRQIKQGVMQELLTGKRRLPGFSGEWEWGKLGELVQTIPGGIYGIEKKVAGLVGAKVATTAHISDEDEWNGKEMAERYFTSTQLEGYLVKTNDLVVVKSSGSAASIKSGKIGLVTEKEANKFVFTNFLMVLRPKNIYSNFLYSYLISHNVKKLLPSLVEASTYPNIRRDEYLAIQIPVPPLNEQKEIAAFLTEQTIEMEALAEKLAKQKQIKQGMMQELLTGRVRLV